MPVTTDILASYRRPSAVLRGHLARAASEPRALAWLMGACGVMFVAQWPRLARQAHLDGTEMEPAMGGALLGTLIILPLVFYVVAGLSQLVLRLFGGAVSGYEARVALFWALLAASPMALLNGLVAGFIGPGVEQSLVGAAWFGAFLWVWISGLRTARAMAGEGAA